MSGKYTALWYGSTTTALATIDPTKGFGKFWYEIQDGDATTARKEDQNGKGFMLPSDGIMISSASCGTSGATPRVHVAVSIMLVSSHSIRISD
jgi:hypothetical protein